MGALFLWSTGGENPHLNFIYSGMTKSHLNYLFLKGNEVNSYIMLWQTTYYRQLLAQHNEYFSSIEKIKSKHNMTHIKATETTIVVRRLATSTKSNILAHLDPPCSYECLAALWPFAMQTQTGTKGGKRQADHNISQTTTSLRVNKITRQRIMASLATIQRRAKGNPHGRMAVETDIHRPGIRFTCSR